MKNYTIKGFLLFIGLMVGVSVWGQYSITGLGSGNTYTQNFDAFRGTSATLPANWAVVAASYNTTYPILTAGAATPTVANATSNNCYAGRASSSSSDYSILQKPATSGSTTTTFTFSAVNNTGVTVTGFVITWNVEQLSAAGRATTVDFKYRLNGGSYVTTGITGTTLYTSSTGASTTFSYVNSTPTSYSITVTGISLPASQTADFQFSVANGSGSGSNAHVGIDDFTVYATAPTYSVTYNGNGNTGGTAPTDASSPYTSGATVTVKANTGSLTKTGYTFSGWNTAADGSGTDYAASGSATFTMPASNVTLYAKWIASGTPTISVGSISAFSSQCVNTTSAEKTYNVSGTDLTANITITPPSGFLISTTSGSGYSSSAIVLTQSGGTVASTPIYVVFNPTAASSYTGNITHVSTGATQQDVAVSGSGSNGTPAVATVTATAITSSGASSGGNTISTTCGTITAKGVVWSTSANPTISSNLGITSDGSGTASYTSAISGLSANTLYHYRAYVTNSNGATAYGSDLTFTTLKAEPTNFPTGFACGTTTASTIPLSWTDASSGVVPDGYLIKWSATSYAAITDPTDGTAEADGSTTKNVAQGVGVYTVSGLTSSTTYYFKIWSYTNSGSNINYKLTSQPQTSCATIAGPCLSVSTFSATPSGWLANSITYVSGEANFAANTGDLATLTIANPASLTFDLRRSTNTTAKTLYVEVSTTSQSSGYTIVATYDHSNTTSGGTITANVDLSAYTAYPSVYIRLRKSSSTTSPWYVSNFNVYCGVACSSPSTQAGSFSSSNVNATTATISWTRGNGDSVIVLAKAGTVVDADPLSGTSYGANAAFGSGAQIGTGNYVVYKGLGTSVNLTNLLGNTTYYFAIYEYASSGICYNVTELTGSLTTSPPDVVLASSNPAVATASITQGVSNNVIYAFNLSPSQGNVSLTGVTITTSGSYVASNISNLKCWYSADAAFSSGTDVLLSTKTTSLAPGTHVFPSFTAQAINNNTTGYIFVTTDLPCTATNGNTIVVNAITTADLTFAAANKSGTAYAGGAQTIATATPNNVTSPATSSCSNGGTTVSWTAPVGCYSNVLVFAKAGSFSSALPSGDGSSYTANTVFGSGTGFDGGYCVYKGTATTTSITGLITGTNYTYKIFTRNGSTWSNGTTVNCSPTLDITDNGCSTSQYAEFPITSALTGLVTDVNVGVKITHPYRGDLKISLLAPDNTEVLLVNTVGGSADNFDAIIDDQGTTLAFSSGNHTVDATYDVTGQTEGVGVGLLSTFNGKSATGTWKARVCDNAGNDVGSLISAELFISACTPIAAVTSFIPTSGAAGTKVTITGTGFTGATGVKFGGVSATSFSVVNSTTIVAEVPIGATTSNITVLDASGCGGSSVATFSILNITGACSGGLTDLFISEIYDSDANNVFNIELYNPTTSPIVLDGVYAICIQSDNLGTCTRTVNITGTINGGSVYTAALGTSSQTCSYSYNFSSSGSGINELDGIYLMKNGTAVDAVVAPNETGYTITRNASASGPNPTYSSADWTLLTTETCAGIGSFTPNATITITSNPTDVTGCSFSMSVSATGSSLSYQWKYNDSLSMTGWSNVTATNLTATNAANSGVSVSGATTNSLSITGDITNLLNYQFYCEVTSSGCTKVTNAAQFYYDTKPIYRTKSTASGNWTTVANWEMATSTAGPWTAACTYPKALNSTEIYIENGITITMDKHIDADYLEIKSGGTLKTTPSTQLTIYNGNTSGADFKVLGTYEDNSNGSNSLVFGTSAKWEMGTSGTIIKTNLASADVYRTGYLNGMVNMPATATWIYRNDGTAANNPTTANAGLYYPNLYFENTTASATDWSNINSTFRGNAIGNCTVYGSLYIGTTGNNPVKIYNNNLNATPMLVYGNVTIGSGSEYTIQESAGNAGNGAGTGINVKGNITNNGTFDVNTSTSGITILSGTSTQVISGAGTFDLWNFELNKPTSTIANQQVDLEVKNNLNFIGGILVTGANTMYVSNSATAAVSGGVTSGTDKYVQGRLKWKTDATSAYIFPIGYSGYGAQGFTIDANAGTSGADVLAYLETNNSAPDYAYGYYDFEDRPTGAVGNVPVGSGNTGFDGILDQINFNLASPLQWHITNPNSATAAITNYDITVHANGSQDIISSVVTSKNGAKLQYLMKNGEPGNDGTTAVGNSAPQFTQTGFLFSAAPNNYVLTGLTGFSKFTLDGVNAGGTILPVTWLYLKATPVENSYIRLDWATASERNNNGFEIERSTDAKNYNKIDFVSGNGTTTSISDYTYNDLTAVQGITYYYRLRQIDYTGNAEYSNIVSAKLNGEATADVVLYPNPVKDILTVNLINMKGKLVASVYNALGQIVISNDFVNDANIYQHTIDLATLANGNYTIVVKANNDIITKKVIVAK